jgi:hypothetical protein
MRSAALAALAAVLLNVLWPLVAQAKPSLLVPVCSIEGTTHYVEVPGAESPLDKRSQAQHDHCKLCVFGADRVLALPAHQAVLVVEAAVGEKPAPRFQPLPAFLSFRPEQSRAPPAVS